MIFTFNNSGTLVTKRTEDSREVTSSFRALKNSGGLYFLGCCGMGGLENFNYVPQLNSWENEAGFMAAIYRYLYEKGTVVYVLTHTQLELKAHQLLLQVGAKEVAVFPNMFHGPNMIHLFMVNIRNICGRYCDKYGKAYAEPPKDESEVIPEPDGPVPSSAEFLKIFNGTYDGWYNGVWYSGGCARLPVAGT